MTHQELKGQLADEMKAFCLLSVVTDPAIIKTKFNIITKLAGDILLPAKRNLSTSSARLQLHYVNADLLDQALVGDIQAFNRLQAIIKDTVRIVLR